MSKTSVADSELARAFRELDDELRRYLVLVDNAGHAPLASQRGLERAVHAAGDAQACEARLAQLMQAFSAALSRAWEDHRVGQERLQVRVDEIARRQAEVQALIERFGALGRDAGEISTAVAALAEAPPPAGDPAKAGLRAQLGAIETRLAELVEQARELARDAQAAGLEELSRNADGLRQQVHAARHRLSVLSKQLAG
jgi:hypothetical protein